MLPAYRLCLVWDEWVPRISTFCGNPTWGKETRRWSTNLCDMMSFYLPVCCMTRQWICLNLCLPHKYTSQKQSVLPCFTCFMWKRTWSNKKHKRLESRERKAKPFPNLGASVHEYLNILALMNTNNNKIILRIPSDTVEVSESIQSRAIREVGIWSACRRRGRGLYHRRLYERFDESLWSDGPDVEEQDTRKLASTEDGKGSDDDHKWERWNPDERWPAKEIREAPVGRDQEQATLRIFGFCGERLKTTH